LSKSEQARLQVESCGDDDNRIKHESTAAVLESLTLVVPMPLASGSCVEASLFMKGAF
jgi:hypothetical protein